MKTNEANEVTTMTKTMVRSYRHRGDKQAACEPGQTVDVTGQAMGSLSTETRRGVVESVTLRLDGRLDIQIHVGGGYVATMAADSVYIHCGAEVRG